MAFGVERYEFRLSIKSHDKFVLDWAFDLPAHSRLNNAGRFDDQCFSSGYANSRNVIDLCPQINYRCGHACGRRAMDVAHLNAIYDQTLVEHSSALLVCL